MAYSPPHTKKMIYYLKKTEGTCNLLDIHVQENLYEVRKEISVISTWKKIIKIATSFHRVLRSMYIEVAYCNRESLN